MTLAPFTPCPCCVTPDTCARVSRCLDREPAPDATLPPRAETCVELEDQHALAVAAGGHKADAGKLPMHLLPPELLTEVSAVLALGAEKYAPRNWERGIDWSRVFSASQRHMWAWWGGEDRDPETGLSHLAHAACCVAFLLAYEARRVGADDRPRDMANQRPSQRPAEA